MDASSEQAFEQDHPESTGAGGPADSDHGRISPNTPVEITIRNIAAADRDAVISVHRRSILGLCKEHYTEYEMNAWTGRLTPQLFDEGIRDRNMISAAAVAADTVVGYGVFNLQSGELLALYIAPDYAGKGVGKCILTHVEDKAKDLAVEEISLQSTLNAVEFYVKAGYRIVKSERHRIDDGVSLPCVRMKKDLKRDGT